MLALRTAVRKVERLAYSPDGTRLAVGGPTGTEVLDVAGGETVALLEWAHEGPLAFGSQPDSLLIGSGNITVIFFDLVKLDPPSSPGGGTLLSQTIHLLPATDEWFIGVAHGVRRNKVARSRNSDSLNSLTVWQFEFGQGDVHPRRLTALDNPSRVVFLGSGTNHAFNSYLYLLDGDSGELLRRCRSGYGNVDHFTGSPCGGYLVGVLQSTLIVWDTAALHLPPKRWANVSRKQFTGVAFHPHGRYLLTASNDKSVKLWDLTCGQVVRSYDWSAGRMRSVAVAPDGLTAAAGSDENLVVLFDLDL